MFWAKRALPTAIAGTKVACVLRGVDIDIEECFACGKLLRVVDDDPPYVVCSAWRTDPRTADIAF